MYSFARVYTYNPFWGGFIRENPLEGTFFRFQKTRVIILEFDVDPTAWEDVEALMADMFRNRKKYRYNYRGLFLAAIRVHRQKEDYYYCSEFVRAMAIRLGIKGAENLPAIIKPIHFLDLPHRVLYKGNLQEYMRGLNGES